MSTFSVKSSVDSHSKCGNRKSSKVFRMDSDQYEYLRNIKRFLYPVALWPHQNMLERILISIFVVPFAFGNVILQCGEMIAALNVGNIDVVIENFSLVFISSMCLTKFTNFMFNYKQMRDILIVMQTDWKIHKKYVNEYDILCQHYRLAKRISFKYAVSISTSMLPIMAMPLALNAVAALGVYNMSDEKPLMYHVENFVNVDKYYYCLLAQSYIGTMLLITFVAGVDSMIIAYIRHECGLCEILGERLKRIVGDDSMNVELHPDKREDRPYQNVRNCAILHKHIIEFAGMIEKANTTAYFFQLGLNLIGVSFTQYQAVTNLDTPSKFIGYGGFTIALLFVLLIVSLPGQYLLDSTERISEYVTSGSWYYTSVNTRKLLSIILLQSIKPLRLTALKVYTFNIENFSSVVRTSFSYCMVLCSVQ